MTWYVANPRNGGVLKELRDTLTNLKMRKISPEGKICFLELIAVIFKKGIELLDFQIDPYHFQDPKQFLKNFPSP